MNIKQVLFTEICISFFIGSLPLIILFKYEQKLSIVSTLAALNPGDPIVYYFFYLLILHLTIYALKKYWLVTNSKISNTICLIHKLTYQVGFTIHSLFRALAGAIPTAIVLQIYINGSDGAFAATIASILLVFGCFFMCCNLSWLNVVTAPKNLE